MKNTNCDSTELTLFTCMIRVYKLLRLPIVIKSDGNPFTIKSIVTSDVNMLEIWKDVINSR